MKHLLTFKDLDLANKKVFLRVDYNVVEDGKVIDEFRISQSLPTIKELLAKNCAIILASHNGRPEGKPNKKLSLKPVVKVLEKLLKRTVDFADDCVGSAAANQAKELKPTQLLLLENLRFHEAEEKNNSLFAKSLSNMADLYIDDAFANAHRAHASMVGIPKYLPHAAGILMQQEYSRLTNLLEVPTRPFMAIIGGAKISTKIEVLEALIKKVDTIFIGGAMANTFLQALGYSVGKSITEQEEVQTAKEIIHKSKENNVDLLLPADVVVASKIEQGAKHRIVGVGKIESNDIALDIGRSTMKSLIPHINKSKTIFWNGTLGYAEIADFSWASRDLAHLMALRKNKADTVIGGGDTTAFIEKLGMHDRFDFVSTGGGASLELLSGKKLPAIEVLMD